MQTGRYLQQRIRSFKYAIQGITAFLRSEPHARIHALATLLVVTAGFYFRLSANQWIAILIVIGMVWITEMLNTVVEKIMDHLSPDYHPRVKWIKDVAAGAVLVAALIAVITGAVIFIPILY
ncbi:diacylglycerol kinase family protein [Chitinophaga rhizophila]|uniref:Diacylglycerol kinase family protein n=1 Tax=Chitinophaga rhizophila TaxID=2866212 RepID=A0ABS7GDN4_9BACT|nr:diacylglycerol kinase family protein [Chitinophaga rhizophila]MBW8685788.1 diacylglycerol kinase family protein [Chitinophaga rhizophila]